MKKLLILAALLLTQAAYAADEVPAVLTAQATPAKPLTIQEQIAADAARDPYAETTKQPLRYELEETTVIEGYQAPAAADHMQPSKLFKAKRGNIVIK